MPMIEMPLKNPQIIEKIRTSVIILQDDCMLFFKAKDPKSNEIFYFLPGGKQEEGESLEACAVRETFEETGYSIKLHKLVNHKGNQFDYTFAWAEQYFVCKTHYFFGSIQKDAPIHAPQDQSYHLGVAWIPIHKLEETLKNTPRIFDHIRHMLGDT